MSTLFAVDNLMYYYLYNGFVTPLLKIELFTQMLVNCIKPKEDEKV